MVSPPVARNLALAGCAQQGHALTRHTTGHTHAVNAQGCVFRANRATSRQRRRKPISTLSLRLPNSIHQNAKLYALREGISVNQLAEKLAALATEDYISARAQRASVEAFEAALALVPDVPVQAGDEWRK